MRPVRWIRPHTALVAAAVPPAQEDAALEDAAGVVPAPGAFGLTPGNRAAPDV